MDHIFETNSGKLYCGESLPIIKSLEDNSIDLILIDPPYNIADSSKVTKKKGKIISNNEAWGNDFQDKWKSELEYWNWFSPFIKESYRLLKEDGSLIIFFDRGFTGLLTYWIKEQTDFYFKNKIYFYKRNPMPHIRKNNYRSAIEEAIWFTKSKSGYKFNFLEQKDMIQVFEGNIGKKHTQHPTEKYNWMIEPLIIRHSNEGDLILDFFAGSGSIGFYAEKLNRRWIMIEKEKRFCDMIIQRFNDYLIKDTQLSIFENF